MELKVQKYKKDFSYSYALGFFPVFELIKHRPETVLEVYLSSRAAGLEAGNKLAKLCSDKRIRFSSNDKVITRISPRNNCFAAGIFKKFKCELNKSANHLVLVSPENAGNLGTIIRTALGFGVSDIAVTKPGVDMFEPSCIRSSMGGVFQANIAYLETFEDYHKQFPKRYNYLFMTSGEEQARAVEYKKPFSLFFGSESSGLPEEYKKYGDSVLIPQTGKIDSLNIAVAAGIALYEASK
ncbi:MAG: RNA methyltransferase [Candidatus Firestonebacteria bacterium]